MATQKHNYHEEAANNYETAAKHHRAAHTELQAGNEEKAASNAQAAYGYTSKGNTAARKASKKHAENTTPIR
jgi:hypothetical protein